jgi:hypothetical protein
MLLPLPALASKLSHADVAEFKPEGVPDVF